MNDKTFLIFKENTAIIHGLNSLAQRVAELEKQIPKKRKGKMMRKMLSTAAFGGIMFCIGAGYWAITKDTEYKEFLKNYSDHDRVDFDAIDDDLDNGDYEED